jgi:membrane protease YdiL (CAAX protease family)
VGFAGLFYDANARHLGPLIRGHVLLFQPRTGPDYPALAGLRLLLIVAVLELVIGPRMSVLSWFGLEPPPSGVRTLILLAIALASVRFLAGVRLSDVGFVPPGRWHVDEVLYLAVVLPAAAAVFVLMFGARLHLFGGGAVAALGLIATQLVWGFYQEVVYRGLLQTELMRRFGTVGGALAADVAFTFGPLHFYHLQEGASLVSTAIMVAAIFGIGLVFAIIFARARNIWLIGLLHGIGNAFAAAGSV